MAESENEIVVEDPTAPAADSPAVASTRSADIATLALPLPFAAPMAF